MSFQAGCEFECMLRWSSSECGCTAWNYPQDPIQVCTRENRSAEYPLFESWGFNLVDSFFDVIVLYVQLQKIWKDIYIWPFLLKKLIKEFHIIIF